MTIQNTHDLPDTEAESIYFSRLRFLDDTARLSYGECGLIGREVKTRKLHLRRIDPETGEPHTFSSWLRDCAPYSYARMYQAIDDIEALSEDVSASDLAQIAGCNFPVMKKLSSSVRADPRVLQAAKIMPSEELIEHINREHPLQHIEARKTLRFRPEESAAATIEEALAMAESKGAKTRDEALEYIAVEALREWKMEAEIEKIAAEMP